MKKNKILCTGNPENSKNIAYTVNQHFQDVDFIYLSNGYDLTTDDGIEKFKNIIGNYNVFFNFSNIGPGVQENLLKITHSVWNDGHVISLGSVAEYVAKNEYTASKWKLKMTTVELNSKTFKASHLSIPGVSDNLALSQIPTTSFIDILETILKVECNISLMTVY